jgi:KDO2-lipid IV(A) lauroyltransferase
MFREIALVFPDESKTTHLLILLKHYGYLGIWISEMAWLNFATAAMIRDRFCHRNDLNEVLNRVRNNERVVIAAAHFSNWEMLMLSLSIIEPRIRVYFVYRPLHDDLSEKLIGRIRKRFHAKPISEKNALRRMASISRKNEGALLIALVDQNPMRLQTKYWLPFLATEIPLTGGIYQLPRAFRSSIYMPTINRPHLLAPYVMDLELLAETPYHPEDKPRILFDYVDHIEKMIRMRPDMWMWSISRRKYDRSPGEVLIRR